MNQTKYILSCFLYFWIIFSSDIVIGQKTRSQLENEKKQAVQKLQDAQKILGQTEKKKENSIGQLKALNYQINVREVVIKTITGEVKLMNDEISEHEMVISSLEDDLDNLKKEYSSMVYTTFKATTGFRNLTYIFSASTFNQLYMRIKYMEQYADERKRQLQLIQKVRESLMDQM
ncbi:murein hydrolase activator EnvC family protein, partial [Bacteroidota bacterium]